MLRTLQAAYEFTRANDVPTIWSSFLRKDTHPVLQFVKYGVFGVMAVIIYQGTFGFLGHTVFPHFEGSLRDGAPVDDAQRKVYFILASAAGFLLADVFAYVANLLWVFQGGRHRRVVEFLLFTAASSIGWAIGMIPGILAFGSDHAGSWASSGIVTITSVIVNYLCRKLFIFHG